MTHTAPPWWRQPGPALVVAATFFNMALCFLNTSGALHVGMAIVVATELLVLTCGLLVVRSALPGVVPAIALAALYLAGLKLINPFLDLKIVRDLAIALIFTLLGRRTGERATQKMLWFIVAAILAIGLVELTLTDLYTRVFDVWRYYVDRGTLAADVINYSNNNLFLSATRGEGIGRTFFPGLLGAHRVSSAFLEPDSMGNFAAILFGWALCIPALERRRAWMLAATGLACIVLADSRFGSGCCLVMLLVRLSGAWRSRTLMFLLPLLVMAGLLAAGMLNRIDGQDPTIISDDLPGRLLFSGRLLDDWTWPEWLALEPSRVYVADSGYAYVINSLGLFPALAMLALFAGARLHSDEAAIMRAMILVYLATGLCIGASVFTIKTAGLLWFLYGVAAARPALSATPAGQAPPRSSLPLPALQ